MIRLLWLATVQLMLTGCCCFCLPTGSDDRSSETVDLGTAHYPADASPSRTTRHDWRIQRWSPSRHRVGYALSKAESDAAAKALADVTAKMKARRIEDGFVFDRRACGEWNSCLYSTLIADAREPLRPLLKQLLAYGGDDLTPRQQLELVTTFVQEIRYAIPDNVFEVHSPVRMVHDGYGDCDSASLLLYVLLTEMGHDVVILESIAHNHVMMGVAVPSRGTTFTWKGRTYALLETTGAWPIGQVRKDLLTPWDWEVVPIAEPK